MSSPLPDNSSSSSSASPLPPRPPSPVRPSSYLRPHRQPPAPPVARPPQEPLTQIDRDQAEGLSAIRDFIQVRTSYDVLPVSFRLIILDTSLLIHQSLHVLTNNGIVSAPLWNFKTSTFGGLLTSSDYINVIQYYRQYPEKMHEVDNFRLHSLREIEQAIGTTPIETVSVHPDVTLYEACVRMLRSRARRIPLISTDEDTAQQMVVSVLTQFRILKFVALNVGKTRLLRKPLNEIKGLVTAKEDVALATMDTPVIDVIEMLVKKDISSVPILDEKGVLLNIYESIDVLNLIKGGIYDDLHLSVGEALLKRPDDFAGVHMCTFADNLAGIFDTINRGRVHRLMVVGEDNVFLGLLTLSDILSYILFSGDSPEAKDAGK